MRAEMLEDYETALGILDKILEEDEANSQVHRNSIRLLEMIKLNNLLKHTAPKAPFNFT